MGRHSPRGDEDRQRALTQFGVGVAVAAILFVAYLLAFRPFASSPGRSSTGAGAVVGEVAGMPSSEEYVGVILKSGSEIADVLDRHHVAGAIMTGGNTFVVEVGEADPEDLIAALDDDADVHDAGRVFERPRSSDTTSAP